MIESANEQTGISSTADSETVRCLRSARVGKKLSLRRAAASAQIDPAHLSRVERGEKQLSLPALRRLAAVLELTELVVQLDNIMEG